MGQKRDPNEPRQWLNRSRKPVKARTGSKAGSESDKAYCAFMGQFRGLPSIMSGNTRSLFLRNDNGKYLSTEGHHILPKSVFPEYRLTPENIAVLTREEHGHVEDHPKEFMNWLHDHHPLKWKWAQEHSHHRKD
ncbi:MAG: hypothetical protein H8E10_10695 [Desulfobacterales bacterium]|nr:hypothetical protein [Desulfobacterales bacterium]